MIREDLTPIISVIIPLYNKAPYISRAIDSILKQTIQNFEIIVVGGKSTDGGEDIVLEYSDARIRLIKEIGNGVSAARNQGVFAARSDLIAFLDADDEWLPLHLEIVLRLQNNFPETKVYTTGYNHVSKNKIRVISCQPKLGERALSYFAESVIAGCNTNIILLSCFAIKKDLFVEVGGFDVNIRYGEDLTLYKYVAVKSKIAYSPEITAIYNYSIPNNTRCVALTGKPLTDISILHFKNVVYETNDTELIQDFEKYLEMTYVENALKNALRGFKSDSYKSLHHISSLKYIHLKCLAHIINLIPNNIRLIIAKWHYGLN